MHSIKGNRFTISQQFTALVNRFDIHDDTGSPIGFAEQKRFNLREQVSVWKDASKDEVLFSIAAEKVFDIHGKYLVSDGNGQQVGYIQKLFVESLLRSTWAVYRMDDTLLFTAVERNLIVALVRRLGAFVPVVGELLEQLPFGFDFIKDGEPAGYHRRKRGLRDQYEIAVEEGVDVDRRVLIALGILLDILQQR
ncbi:MAG TPA: hypothetical protein VGB97_03685 [Candidatus Paceibacterota bacterium]|jgi:hypothetical protein